MPQWKPEDEALFAELCRRAEQQSREAALRAAPAPPPRPPRGRPGLLPPRRLRRRAAARRAGFLPKPRPLRPAAPPSIRKRCSSWWCWPFYCAAALTVSSFGRCFIFCFFSFFAKKRDPRFARK